MAIDFPGSPSTGQRHSHNNTTWEWDGSSWNRITIDLSTTDAATLSGIAATQFTRRDDDNIITGVTTFIGNGYAGVGNTVLIVEGDARVTGVLSVGQGSLAINERDIYAAGVVTATTFVGALTGNVTGNVSGSAGSASGNAATATALQNARTIGGVSFDGTANINLPGVNATGNQDTSGNAATAGKLQTARTIGGVSFDGSGNINLPGVNQAGNQNTTGTAALAEGLTGTPDIIVRNVTVTGIQTAEDVKNIDSVGIITARTGIDVTGGTFKADGLVGAAGSVLSSTGSGINWVSPQTGPQGAAGAQGAVGAQGAAGAAGAQGAQGAQGRQGAQGVQGAVGAQGNQGVQGATGNTGAQGVQGAQGRQGAQGATGSAGAAGAAGAQGAQGHQGVQGAQGHQGVQGAQGHQGVQGSVGIASLTISTSAPSSPAQGDMWWDSDDATLGLYYNDGNSSQWVNINHGPSGAQGHQGVQGATGSTGAAGAQGAQGRQGATGSTGAAGAQGAQGVQGATGSTGSTGAQGHQGVQGAANATTINNNAAQRIITGSGSANTLEANSSLTWSGATLASTGRIELESAGSGRIELNSAANIQIESTSQTVVQAGGQIQLKSSSYCESQSTRFEFKNAADNATMAVFHQGSDCELYFNNSKKFETTNTGISITGIPVATQSTGNIGLELHATGNGRGSQTKYHNDHGVQYVGTAGDTSGDLLIWQESNANMLFATNNTERLRITPTGLVTNKGTWTNTYAANDTTQCGYQTQNLSDTTNTYAALRLTAGSSSPATAQLSSIRTGAGANDFTIQLESSNTAFEALRITSGGAVIVGTDAGQLQFGNPSGGNPTFKENGGALEVWTSNAKRWTVESNGNNVYEDDVKIFFGSSNDFRFWHDGGDNYIWGTGNHATIFATNGTERLRIQSNGNVSIGNNPTVHADTIFHIEDSGETDVKIEGSTSTLGARISLQNNDTTANAYSQYAFNDAGGQSTSAIQGINTDQTNNYGELAFLTRNAQGSPPAERLRIDKDGKVGIGIDNPNRLLTLYGDTGIALQNSTTGTGNSNGTHIWVNSSGNGELLIQNRENSDIEFYTNDQEKLRITSTGEIDTGSRTITGGNNLAIQAFRVKRVWSGSPSIGKSCELISGYDSSVKMAAIGYNLTDTNTGSTYGGDLTLHTQPLYSSPTTPLPVRMRVSSSGYVTKPNQPYCDVTLDTNRTCGARGVHRFSDSGGFGGHYFTSVRNNIGSHYNSSNSRFTVPVTGAYLICMNIAVTGSNPDSYLGFEWYKNGSRAWYGGWQRAESSGYHRHGTSTIWYLTKGDYLEPSFETDATVSFLGHTNSSTRYTGFSIMLLA